MPISPVANSAAFLSVGGFAPGPLFICPLQYQTARPA